MPITLKNSVVRAMTIVVVAVFGCSCSSTKQPEKPVRKSSVSESLSRVLSREPKQSMFDPENSRELTPKTFHNSKVINGKEYRGKKFIGSKDYRTNSFVHGKKSSNWADKSSRDSKKKLSSDLDGTYSTGTNRYSGQSARESKTGNYRTGTYRTGQDIIGTRGIESASPPKVYNRGNTQRGMTEAEIQALLDKNY